jgi:type IV pilus assembly protein PilW
MTLHQRKSPFSKQAGLTLIELMVSLVIGLLLAIVASSTYLYSKQAYNAVSENSQMEENGRLALNMLTRNIRSAGFVTLNIADGAPVPSQKKILGCEFGMLKPQGATATSDYETCLTSVPAGTTQSGSISVFYQSDPPKTSGVSYQGVDCIGNSPVNVAAVAGSAVTTTWMIRSHFYISSTTVGTPNGTTTMGQLSCATDPTGAVTAGSFQTQPLIPGIHQLRARYLLPTDDRDFAPGQKIYEAFAPTSTDWARVVGVELCVLTKSIQPSGNDTATAVTDCYGNQFTPPPSQSYRRFTTTVNLRNRSTPPA